MVGSGINVTVLDSLLGRRPIIDMMTLYFFESSGVGHVDVVCDKEATVFQRLDRRRVLVHDIDLFKG